MCQKREMETDLVYNGIGGPVTVECKVEPPTPKRRRIIIRCDDEEGEDDKEETRADESIEYARQPPVFPVQEEANSPQFTNVECEDQGTPIDDESERSKSNRHRLTFQSTVEKNLKAEESCEQTQQAQVIPGLGENNMESGRHKRFRLPVPTARVQEDIRKQLSPYMVQEGIFRKLKCKLDKETGGILSISGSPKVRYDCLYCRLNGKLRGRNTLHGAKKHRETCTYKPNLPDPSVEQQDCPTNHRVPPPQNVQNKAKHWSRYFVKFDTKKWACRACQEHREAQKYWKSQGWVRRHWMSCAYNANIKAGVPLVPKTKKMGGNRRKVIPGNLVKLIY